jgi:hypothetical protein
MEYGQQQSVPFLKYLLLCSYCGKSENRIPGLSIAVVDRTCLCGRDA